MEDEALLSALAGSILDDEPIDWSAAESTAHQGLKPVLDELKVVEALARVHRSIPEPARDDADLKEWGHLHVLERLGAGAFGAVYRAWDPRLDREVALKLLPARRQGADDPASTIIEEGRLLARVRHPNVVTIYGAEQIGERVGLWMEIIHGRTLAQIVREGFMFSERESVRIGVDLCGAVEAVHRAGLLHRDIKAQNVMRGDDGRTVLMDFGTGRDMAAAAAFDFAGTPLYLAPEIFEGHAATVQSDIYSLGILLHYLATGSYPVQAETVAALRSAHESNQRVGRTPAELRKTVSRKLSRIIERATDPRPEHRYPTVDSFGADLAALVKRPSFASIAYPAAVAAAVLLGIWAMQPRVAGPPEGVPVRPGAVADQPILAVLPFENLNAEPNSDEVVDGLTDEIIRNLAIIDGLQVRSRTSSFAFKDTPRNIRDVGRRLNATHVVEGSVLRAGDRLRINVQLIHVADDRALWAERFDRERSDLFAVQDDISRAIVNALRLTLGRGQRRYDTSVETYELFLRGRALVDRKGVPSLENAAALFQQVLAREPAFAPAHAGLANAYALMSAPLNSRLPFDGPHAVLRQAAFKARELDPLLADAHAAIGWVYAREHDWPNAEQAFRRAIELDPSLTPTFTSFSLSTLQPLGRLDEALEVLERALQNDPLSLDLQREIGAVMLLAGRYADAAATLQRVVAADPDFPFAPVFLGRAWLFAGRAADAVLLLEGLDGRNLGRQKPANPRRAPWLARAYVMSGRQRDAESLVGEHRDSPVALAIIHAALGNNDGAFLALEQVAARQPHHIPRLLIIPEMSPLHGDPRLALLRERFGIASGRHR